MAVVVPKGGDAWPDSRKEEPFRVEYRDRLSGEIGTIYFSGLAEASFYADANRTRNQVFCVVESRDMPCTHEVHNLAIDSDYTLSIKRYGDLDSALVEFTFCKTRARKYGGRVQLRAVGVEQPIAEYSHKED